MIVNAQFRLIDAPLMDNQTRIRMMVERMARDLVAADAFHEPKEAMRALMLARYPAFVVLRLVDNARQLAMQEIVAAEMMKP